MATRYLKLFDSPGQPPEIKLALFNWLLRFCWLPLPLLVRDFVETLLFGVGPSIPVTLGTAVRKTALARTFSVAAGLTFVAALVVQVVWSMIEGTFAGSDPARIYLSDDWPNLVNFGVLCPLYVGLSALIIHLALAYGVRLKRVSTELGSTNRWPSMSVAAAVGLAFAVSAANNSKYIAECVDPTVYARAFWFVGGEMAGIRTLGASGVYYALLNFMLLFILLLALLAWFAIFGLAVTATAALRRHPALRPLDFARLKHGLEGFILAYIVAKLIVASLIVNVYTWGAEQPHKSFNFVFMGGALTLLGLFFVSAPRYMIELEWFRFKVRHAQATGQPIDAIDSEDLRPAKIRWLAHFLDTFLIGSFITSFWSQLAG